MAKKADPLTNSLAIIVGAAITLLAAGVAEADERCRGVPEVIRYAQTADPAIEFTIYIRNNWLGSDVLFSRPGRQEILIVGFKAGCMKDKVEITRDQLGAWLAGRSTEK